MPTASTILDAHTTLQVHSLDRLYLNAYVPQLQRPELVRRFLERANAPIASPALFKQRSDAFVHSLQAYAAQHEVPRIDFERGQRKEDRLRPLFAAAERAGRTGLVAMGVAQERTSTWRAAKSALPRGGVRFDFSRQSAYVNQYYLYLFDAQWGPSFIKLSSYAPWGGRIWLNGHEWLKRQLAHEGIGFTALDNGLLAVERPALAAELAAALGPDQVRRYFARWMADLPQPLTPEDRAAGYAYALSMLQIEVSDTRVFDRPYRGRQWFEATIADQLTLGRPERASLLFLRRSNRRTTTRFETRVITPYTIPAISFRYKHTITKQYLKGGRALRTETTFADSYDFEIGRSIEHLGELRAKGEAINARLLELEHSAELARLEGPELTELVLPRRDDGGRRIAALRFGDPRVMALFAALVALAHQAAGFRNAQLRRSVAALLSLSLEEYSRARMTYDLGRLAGHGLIERSGKTRRYQLTPRGLRIAAFCTKLADRVLDPGIARCAPAAASGPSGPWTRFDRALDALIERAKLAA